MKAADFRWGHDLNRLGKRLRRWADLPLGGLVSTSFFRYALLFWAMVFVSFPSFVQNVLGTADKDFFKGWENFSDEIVYRELDSKTPENRADFWGLDGRRQQIGSQGHFYGQVLDFFGGDSFASLHVLSAFLTAVGLASVTLILFYKRQRILAISLFISALFSPWFVSAAKNLYWVSWAYLVALTLAALVVAAKGRVTVALAHLGLFSILTFRFAAGYEFSSWVMVSVAAMPLLMDFNSVAARRLHSSLRRHLRSITQLSLNSLASFISVFIFHSWHRGEGSMWAGAREIFFQDVLRRTFGNPDNFDERYRVSLEGTWFDSLRIYVFEWRTNLLEFDLLPGLPFSVGPNGLWLLFSAFVLGISAVAALRLGRVGGLILLVGVVNFAPISWFVLAKGHSIIHPSINFLLWYPLPVATLVAATILVAVRFRRSNRPQQLGLGPH